MNKLLLPLLLFASTQVMAVGTIYQEGVDTVIPTSCEPTLSRTDGTPMILDEFTGKTEIVFSQNTLFSTIEKRQMVDSINCINEYPLATLGAYGQWYKTARIEAKEGGWSALQPINVPFEWLSSVVIPPPVLPTEIPKADWTLHFVTSEETLNWPMPAVQAWDNDVDTLWHSQYTPTEAQMPHAIEWYLGGIYKVAVVQIQPRENGGNGAIKDFKISTSMNGTIWTDVYTGVAPAGGKLVTAEFTSSNAKYIRVLVISEQDGGQQASIAELYAFGELVVLKPPKPPKNVR